MSQSSLWLLLIISKLIWHLYLLGKITLNFWHFLKIIFCQIVLSTRSVQGAKKESLERVIVELRWPRIHFHFGSVKNSLQMGWHFISADISILQDVEEFISSITTIWKKCFLRSDNMNHTKYHFHVTPYGWMFINSTLFSKSHFLFGFEGQSIYKKYGKTHGRYWRLGMTHFDTLWTFNPLFSSVTCVFNVLDIMWWITSRNADRKSANTRQQKLQLAIQRIIVAKLLR